MIILRLKVFFSLGILNCLNVIIYRIRIKTGRFKKNMPILNMIIPECIYRNGKYESIEHRFNSNLCIKEANLIQKGTIKLFRQSITVKDYPPKWFKDPLSKNKFADKNSHWSECNYKINSDIKIGWELSRWQWALTLARAYRYSLNQNYLKTLEDWIEDWCIENPINSGINWSCGQEVSIRLINALLSWKILDNVNGAPIFTKKRAEFTFAHLERIKATHAYAKAQCNNHWVVESSALFIGYNWLIVNNYEDRINKNYDLKKEANKSRKSLEKAINKLIMNDGSFSQHSLNYHRLLLDTLCQVELWRRWLKLKPFSKGYRQKCFLAVDWLGSLIDLKNGKAPNLGNNDGAHCFLLCDCSYTDFRPSLQLSSYLFKGYLALEKGSWDQQLYFLDINLSIQDYKNAKLLQSTKIFKEGGYIVIRSASSSWALLRLPIYPFRPAQADPLHIDMWNKGVNILRDGGTFSYNYTEKDSNYFGSICSHNTIQFDNKEPMKKLSKFLWGEWLKPSSNVILKKKDWSIFASGEYKTDTYKHERHLILDKKSNQWIIKDFFNGFKNKAIIRWRLNPDNWIIKDNKVEGSMANFKITSNQPIKRFEINTGEESLYYLQKNKLPVIEIEIINSPCIVNTFIELK